MLVARDSGATGLRKTNSVAHGAARLISDSENAQGSLSWARSSQGSHIDGLGGDGLEGAVNFGGMLNALCCLALAKVSHRRMPSWTLPASRKSQARRWRRRAGRDRPGPDDGIRRVIAAGLAVRKNHKIFWRWLSG